MAFCFIQDLGIIFNKKSLFFDHYKHLTSEYYIILGFVYYLILLLNQNYNTVNQYGTLKQFLDMKKVWYLCLSNVYNFFFTITHGVIHLLAQKCMKLSTCWNCWRVVQFASVQANVQTYNRYRGANWTKVLAITITNTSPVSKYWHHTYLVRTCGSTLAIPTKVTINYTYWPQLLAHILANVKRSLYRNLDILSYLKMKEDFTLL